MTIPEDQIHELQLFAPDFRQFDEGGYTYFLLPQLSLPEGCTPTNTDALLCPMPRDGYTSRLFFSEVINSPRSLNWNAQGVRILERNWHAVSWRINHESLRLVQMIATHLGAFR